MEKLNTSARITGFIFFGILVLIFICNMLTPLAADDFTFHFNLTTQEPITEISDIIPALVSHAEHHNGRLVAHSFVYLFEILPKFVFNIVNSIMFVLQIGLMYTICKGESKNNLLLLAIFGSIWMFEPAFGDVNLWLPGSCNYLWCVVFGLLFVLPFINDFLYDKQIKNTFVNILHIVISFMAGAWLENGSAPFIFIAVALSVLSKFYQKKKVHLYRLIDIAVSVIGYLSIYLLSAGEFKNKSAEFKVYILRENFINALKMYRELLPLLIAFVVLLVIAVMRKTETKKIILAVIFMIGSVLSNFMMTVASYFPERCMICATILLIVSNGLLLQTVFASDYKVLFVSVIGVLLLLTSYNVILGVNDIYVSYSKVKANEAYILECKENGIMDITVPMFPKETKYNPVSYYLNSESSDFWTNAAMSRFYGVDSILGKW